MKFRTRSSSSISITPKERASEIGTGMQATITGTGFLQGAKPTFVNGSGGPQPKAESIVWVNSTTITCIVKVGTESTPQVRTWDVKVENTNHAIGLLVGGLTVTQRQ